MKRNALPPIYICIVMDLIGLTSYLLPVIGETEDLIWAPVSGIIFYFLFGRKRFGMLGGILSFLEEISPGLDFIPTFTIAWFIRKYEIVKKGNLKRNNVTYHSALDSKALL
ncbi:MAG TPA: hypothetical protein VN726_12680 [Hanamia sp.]|nr:hypothetical protein [Hanamia sp.]